MFTKQGYMRYHASLFCVRGKSKQVIKQIWHVRSVLPENFYSQNRITAGNCYITQNGGNEHVNCPQWKNQATLLSAILITLQVYH